MDDQALTEKIIGCAMKVHRTLGPGFLEAVYQQALAHELRQAGLSVVCQFAIRVLYDGIEVGTYSADMLVEGRILVENKAIHALVPANEVQVVNYLTATGIDTGLLLNFGAPSLEFRRKSRVYRPRRASA